MAGYVRQSAADIVPTAVVRAAPINNELNALRDAFTVAGGHKHDGTASEGHLIPLISDVNARNRVVVDAVNNRISFFINVSSTSVEQLRLAAGALLPVTDDAVDLGSSTQEFKDLWIDGTANIDSLIADTADINAGTIDGAVIGSASPNAITGTTVTATVGFVGGLTGNVTGNLTGNSAGTHTGPVIGNVTGDVTGNVTASSGTSTFNNVTINGTLDMSSGTAGTITGLSTPSNSTDAATKGYVDAADALKLNLSGGTMSGAIAMGSNKITGLGTPTNDADAATKLYVDNAVQGLDAKASVRAATTANISLSGAQTIDGVSVIAGNRVLVKDQSTAAENGIYVAASGSWTRADDANTWDELVAAFVFVEEGTANGDNGFVSTVNAGGSLGSTAVTFVQFSGAGQITAGTGLTKTGNTINVNTASSARIVVGADEIDLAATGIVAGTYRSLTVDQWGRATAGTNPTTISGYGITDAYTKTEVDTALSGKLNLTGGTMTGNIAMGANKVTSTATPTNDDDLTRKGYVDSILGSATSAAASAAAAAISESNAAGSASAASASASSALSSANAAAASYDSFDDRYLGPKTSDPTLDNDGNALLTGALYFNSVAGEMRVWSGSAWTAAYLPSSGYLTTSDINTTVLGYVAPGTSGNVLTSDGTNWTSASLPAGGLTYVTKTANYTTQDKEGVLADTTGGSFTVTLPAMPSVGAQVVVADSGGAWDTNNLTIGRNGSTISNVAQDLVCDISGVSVQLVYDGTTWEVYAQVGGNGGTVVTETDTQTLTNKTLVSPVITENVQVIGTNTTAIASRIYVFTASLTLTLPASPSAGDWVKVQNSSGTTTAVIARNGSNIMSLAENLTLDADFVSVTLVYADATRGWVFG